MGTKVFAEGEREKLNCELFPLSPIRATTQHLSFNLSNLLSKQNEENMSVSVNVISMADRFVWDGRITPSGERESDRLCVL
jgi:hypothetical protein